MKSPVIQTYVSSLFHLDVDPILMVSTITFSFYVLEKGMEKRENSHLKMHLKCPNFIYTKSPLT